MLILGQVRLRLVVPCRVRKGIRIRPQRDMSPPQVLEIGKILHKLIFNYPRSSILPLSVPDPFKVPGITMTTDQSFSVVILYKEANKKI